MANQLFAKKSLEAILKEMAGEHRLKRALGPVTLTALGIGAVIGAGIFVATGAAAKDVAGPALMVSYLFAGVTCIFAALCYAEFAAMAPVAGSAYTYAYTTLGELFAWIIGWDLVLEYAVGAATVANSWSGYLQSVLGTAGIVLPMALVGAPQKYDQGHILPNMVAKIDGQSVAQMAIKEKEANWPDGSVKAAEGVFWVRVKERISSEAEPEKDAKGLITVLGPVSDESIGARATDKQYALFNLPAVFITFIMTLILIKGISESAGFNALMVGIKVAAVLFVIVVGGYYVNPANWTNNFAPYGWSGISIFGAHIAGQTNAAGDPVGVLAGAAIIFFAYIGFDAVSTQAEEAKNPQRDVPIGIIASLLICTILYIAVVAVLTGMVPYQDLSKDAGVSDAFKGIGMQWAQVIVAIAGVAGITSVLLVMMLSAPRVFLAMARDGLVPKGIFARIHPKFQTPWISTILIGVFVAVMTAFLPITALLHLTNIGTLFAFVIVCTAVLIMRRINPGAVRPFRCPMVPIVPILGIAFCLLLMLSLPPANWYRLIGWLALGLVIYFGYGKRHSLLGKQLRGELSTHGVSGAGMLDQGNKQQPGLVGQQDFGDYPVWNQLFARKSLERLHAEMQDDNRLRRVLGPVGLTALGIGATIGAGIFVTTGGAAATKAGPSVMLAYVVAGLGCALAALCYAEFASMAPVAGSAYTYAYATLGELFAWIIGWDLVLEYAMSCAVIAADWTKYFNEFLEVISFGTIRIPERFSTDAWTLLHKTDPIYGFNVLAVAIMAGCTALLIVGIKESATTNAVLVAVKVGVVLFVIGVGIRYIDSKNWTSVPVEDRLTTDMGEYFRRHPDFANAFSVKQRDSMDGAEFLEELAEHHPELDKRLSDDDKKDIRDMKSESAKWGAMSLLGLNHVIEPLDEKYRSPFMPYGLSGIMVAAASVFFAYLGFDAISTHSEEAKKPQRDVPIGILLSLGICTLLYFGVSAVITGMEPYPTIDKDASVAVAFKRLAQHNDSWALRASAALIATGALAGMTSVILITFLSQARIFLAMARDGLLPKKIFGAVHPKYRTPHLSTLLTGAILCLLTALTPMEELENLVNIGTLLAFIIVCAAVLLLRIRRPEVPRPFRCPIVYVLAPLGIFVNLSMMLFLPKETWLRLIIWLAIGIVIYLIYGRVHSTLTKDMKLGSNASHVV